MRLRSCASGQVFAPRGSSGNVIAQPMASVRPSGISPYEKERALGDAREDVVGSGTAMLYSLPRLPPALQLHCAFITKRSTLLRSILRLVQDASMSFESSMKCRANIPRTPESFESGHGGCTVSSSAMASKGDRHVFQVNMLRMARPEIALPLSCVCAMPNAMLLWWFR